MKGETRQSRSIYDEMSSINKHELEFHQLLNMNFMKNNKEKLNINNQALDK